MVSRRRKSSHHRKKPDSRALVVGRRVRLLRQERGFTFDAFVEETGLGRGYISELDRGLVVPSLEALGKIAAALEITIADLVLDGTPRDALYEATRGLSVVQLEQLLEHAARLSARRGT